jgi:dUTP pyrophosphatase
MEIKIKRLHPNAVIPKYAKQGDAGMDLTAVSFDYVSSEHVKYNFGIAIEIPKGYVGLIFPRSSCYKQGQLLSNSVGVIDSGYRGEISAVMIGYHPEQKYKVGDRVAQIVILPYPEIVFIESESLSETERGDGGYGSTGKN